MPRKGFVPIELRIPEKGELRTERQKTLFDENLGMADNIVNRLCPEKIDRENLRQIARLALLKSAIIAPDNMLREDFQKLTATMIRREIINTLRREGGISQMQHTRTSSLTRKINSLKGNYLKRFSRFPTNEELAEELKFKRVKTLERIQEGTSIIPEESNTGTLQEIMSNHSRFRDPREAKSAHGLAREIQARISQDKKLHPIQKKRMGRIVGLIGENPDLKYKEIAAIMGITAGRVTQLIQKIRQLTKPVL